MRRHDKAGGSTVWPQRVWLVQSRNGTTIIGEWFTTREAAKRAGGRFSPEHDWIARSFVPTPRKGEESR